MELRTLRYFLAAANEENITRAADILHVTQPTLSRQLMDLEKELGTTLMLRGKKGMTLTDDGIYFRQRAEEIVELADRLEQDFVERNTGISGVISIGASEAAGSRLFAKLIAQFSEKYPLVQFNLYNEMADQIKDRLDKGLVDVGLLLEPVDTVKYDFVRLSQKETWGILMRRDHPPGRADVYRASGTDLLSADPASAGTGAHGDHELAEVRGKGSENPSLLHAPVQHRPPGGGGPGLRILSGWRTVHPQQPGPAFCPHLTGAYHPQRADLEEESPVLSCHIPLHPGNQPAPS